MDRLQQIGRRLTQFARAAACVSVLISSTNLLAADVQVEKVLGDLQAPCGVAIRPDTGGAASEVFVVDRGSGRVLKVSDAKSGAGTEVIAGFPTRLAKDNSSTSPGIQSLLFLDHTRMVIAGSNDARTAFLRLYDLSDSEEPLTADSPKQNIDLPADDSNAGDGHRSFHDLARTLSNDQVSDALIVATSDESGAGKLWRVPVRANTLGKIAAFKAVKSNNDAATIGGIAIASPGYIVVAFEPEHSSERASELKFLDPVDGHTALRVSIDAQRVVGLAYSPKSGNLYAAAIPTDGKPSGIFRLDDVGKPGKPACKAVRVAEVSQPTALAFTPEGVLYVTSLGEAGDKNGNNGTLLKLTGVL